MSDRNSSNKLTMSQKIQQFKDYYLGGTLAVLAVAALIIYMISRFLSPQENAPVLRVAVFDTELSAEAQEEMAQAVRASLNLPEYARLSILSADGMVDAVIAGQEAFAELAGFGYFKDLSLYLPEDMQTAYAGEILPFTYESGAVSEDAQLNGELASGEYPFGLSLEKSSLWSSMTANSSVKPEKPVLGVILESENDENVRGFVKVMME